MSYLTLADIVKKIEPKEPYLPPRKKALAMGMGYELIREWADAIGLVRYRSRTKRRRFARLWLESLKDVFIATGGIKAGWVWNPLTGPEPGIAMLMDEHNTILDDIPWQ